MLKECELKTYVDFVISGDECKKSKPDPEIYRLATNALNSLSEEVLAVEDSMLGIRSAKSAGLTVAALAQKDYYANQTEADYKINDLIEITSII
ncbi:HAD-IA family hydrolase [Clostridium sp. DMHC 10]|nr:HAD-IA family hydrolase [Clostridium sp. DMHC 10]